MQQIRLKIGCAVWSYPGWVGEVYPPKTPSKDYLRVYSQHFPAVEGNTTFYAIPDRVTVDRWIAQTPADFDFCLKFPRSITHDGLLAPQILSAQVFITQMQALGHKLGVMFLQLPPNYAPNLGLADLTTLLTAISHQNVKIAIEVRHLDWFNSPHQEQLNELLFKLGIGRVILDSRPIYKADQSGELIVACKKPNVPIDLSLTAPFSLIRYVSHPVRSANKIWLEQWAVQIKSWLQQDTQIYLFVHCPIEAQSPMNAHYLHEIFTRSGIDLAALPAQFVDRSPVQLKLF
jgi:uncharacterized protein YecE (DUF72 family)